MATCPTIWEEREMILLSTRWAPSLAFHTFGTHSAMTSPAACAPCIVNSSVHRLTWFMCAGQSQDGKGVQSGSGYELSELMKRRLESVASTGSSASSGFIEDKSYCDSEEEEEGKGQARLTSLHTPPPSVVPPAVPLPSPLNRHPAQERKPPLDCSPVRAWWDTSSSCSAVQSQQQEPVSPHWDWGGNCLFPALTWLLLRSFGFSTSAMLSANVLFLVSLAVYSGGPVEGLLASSSCLSTLGIRFTWHKRNRKNCNMSLCL